MENNPSHGGKNLIILGLVATSIALVTSGVSLYLYHSSGDIYLDRSRPGYLPEEDEKDDSSNKYIFSDTGEITAEILDEFLENLDKTIEGSKSVSKPFPAKSISDDTLGIPAK